MTQPSVGRIFKRDWPSRGWSVFIGLVWSVALACYLLSAVWYPDDQEGRVFARVMFAVASAVTAICGALVVRRVRLIRRVFGQGEVVEGRVVSLGENSENIGYAVIAYPYQGREYQVRSVTEGAVAPGGFTPGDRVEMVVDPGKPSRAFVTQLLRV